MKNGNPLDFVKQIASEFEQDIEGLPAGRFCGPEGRPPVQTVFPRPGDPAIIRFPRAWKDEF